MMKLTIAVSSDRANTVSSAIPPKKATGWKMYV